MPFWSPCLHVRQLRLYVRQPRLNVRQISLSVGQPRCVCLLVFLVLSQTLLCASISSVHAPVSPVCTSVSSVCTSVRSLVPLALVPLALVPVARVSLARVPLALVSLARVSFLLLPECFRGVGLVPCNCCKKCCVNHVGWQAWVHAKLGLISKGPSRRGIQLYRRVWLHCVGGVGGAVWGVGGHV
eukprot:362360-Chlamydomonas_euryale.AAC.8